MITCQKLFWMCCNVARLCTAPDITFPSRGLSLMLAFIETTLRAQWSRFVSLFTFHYFQLGVKQDMNCSQFITFIFHLVNRTTDLIMSETCTGSWSGCQRWLVGCEDVWPIVTCYQCHSDHNVDNTPMSPGSWDQSDNWDNVNLSCVPSPSLLTLLSTTPVPVLCGAPRVSTTCAAMLGHPAPLELRPEHGYILICHHFLLWSLL